MGKEKPADGKYTRKGESSGKRLTPGERAINWAKAIAIIVPLVGIGAIVDEPIKRFFTEPLEEIDGQTELTDERLTFEQSVVKFSKETRSEIDAIKAQLKKISAKSNVKESSLQQQITKWHGND